MSNSVFDIDQTYSVGDTILIDGLKHYRVSLQYILPDNEDEYVRAYAVINNYTGVVEIETRIFPQAYNTAFDLDKEWEALMVDSTEESPKIITPKLFVQ